VLDLDETLVHTSSTPIAGYETKFAYTDHKKYKYLVTFIPTLDLPQTKTIFEGVLARDV